jgi:hypothetical protein
MISPQKRKSSNLGCGAKKAKPIQAVTKTTKRTGFGKLRTGASMGEVFLSRLAGLLNRRLGRTGNHSR